MAAHIQLEVCLDIDDITADHFHPENESATGHFHPDPPTADHAQCFPVQLCSGMELLFPSMGFHRQVSGTMVANGSQHQPERVLGNGYRGCRGSVGDLDSLFFSGFQIDVIQPDAGSNNQLQVRGGSDNILGHLGRSSDYRRVEFRNCFYEFCFVHPGLESDVKIWVRFQLLEGVRT